MRMNLKSVIETKIKSQIVFSKLAHIDPPRLSKIVRGHIEPTPVERDRFVELLNVAPDFLFKRFTIPAAHAEPPGPSVLAAVSGELAKIIEAIDSK
jgi:hypothetical protein